MFPRYIIIHHSATDDGPEFSWGAIRRYHKETNGWRDIGYHAGVELVGTQPEMLLGRMWDEVGAHCIGGGMNIQSLGVCLVGDYDKKDVPEDSLRQLVFLVRFMMRGFKIPIENVKKHSDYDPKSCPGIKFPWARFTALLVE
jgi:N-acetylmuramoyl-L-alanine amidase